MKSDEKKFLDELKKLPVEKQIEVYYMTEGAKLVIQKENIARRKDVVCYV